MESDWYDGPRGGIADVNGQPHRFSSLFDDSDQRLAGTFIIFPVDDETLGLEIEQWDIFVDWNDRYEAGLATTETHPACGGVSLRWDELEASLERRRAPMPSGTCNAHVKVVRLGREKRYDATGPDYALRWKVLEK